MTRPFLITLWGRLLIALLTLTAFARVLIGGLFMGLIGSGQGELNGYFLLRCCLVPSQVAVAMSAFAVAVTLLTASLI